MDRHCLAILNVTIFRLPLLQPPAPLLCCVVVVTKRQINSGRKCESTVTTDFKKSTHSQ